MGAKNLMMIASNEKSFVSPWLLAVGVASALCIPQARAGDSTSRWNASSNVLTGALPLAAATLAFSKDDSVGLGQLGLGLASAVGVAEVLKHQVHATRPDGSDRKSFPSAQTSVAFTAARFMDKRYGESLGGWTPWLYAGAAMTGVARVQANRHHWVDVVGGAALGYGAASWWSEPVQGGRLSVVPAQGGLALAWQRSF